MDWGCGTSPIVWKDAVFFCMDDDLSPYVVAIDAATGKQRWKTPRLDMLAGYAIPVMCEAGGRTDLQSWPALASAQGLRPAATGKEIWTRHRRGCCGR